MRISQATRPWLIVMPLLCFLSVAAVAEDTKEPTVNVTAKQISKEFWDNTNEATKKYKGQSLEVEGQVAEPLKHGSGSFADPGNDSWTLELAGNGSARVTFLFYQKSPEFKKAQKLNPTKGQSVKIRCVCDGGTMYGPRFKNPSVSSK